MPLAHEYPTITMLSPFAYAVHPRSPRNLLQQPEYLYSIFELGVKNLLNLELCQSLELSTYLTWRVVRLMDALAWIHDSKFFSQALMNTSCIVLSRSENSDLNLNLKKDQCRTAERFRDIDRWLSDNGPMLDNVS